MINTLEQRKIADALIKALNAGTRLMIAQAVKQEEDNRQAGT